MGTRITTWNVNGIRNPFGYQPWRDIRTFEGMFDILEADIVVMQELKIQRKDLRDDMVLIPGWDCFFSLPKYKKGYSGVGIYTRQTACAPIRAEEGVLGVLSPPGSSTAYRDQPPESCIGGYPDLEPLAELDVDPASLDAEGRCVVLEFPAFVLFGVYSPANSNGMRDEFRYAFLTALETRLRNLDRMGKRVVLVGDLNITRTEEDSAAGLLDVKKMVMTHEEFISTPNRRLFNQLIEGGEVVGDRDGGRENPILWDVCRGFHEGRHGMYTHWEQKINARPGNYGSRIDYVLASISMKSWFSESNIQEGLLGSDHCPVYADFKDIIQLEGKEVFFRDLMTPPGTFVDGQLANSGVTKSIPALSGRLLPEFDRRQSIKDMFTRKAAIKAPASSPPETRTGSQVPAQFLASSPASASLGTKRKGAPSKATPALKHTKIVGSNPQHNAKNGQLSLKGFFAPKVALSSKTGATNVETECSTTEVGQQPPDAAESQAMQTETILTESDRDDTASQSEGPLLFPSEAAKEGWSKLFTKRGPPLCDGHGEQCITYTTKKKGPNFGRSFWICPRPVGPTGTSEVSGEWRCKTFIWTSDWNREGKELAASK
ncbi:DNase I-like protein [Trichodelitschia bisporula]|uniref:DNA-(apurinic or apyrimidinic site) endonuclease 2 n=1 Tax=Trichodelitschia bisporula TaxID=703511 RepID=A0A6G1HN62_9PEZI|nr:DNase I-like protein [Trichodelitschia bisporula]